MKSSFLTGAIVIATAVPTFAFPIATGGDGLPVIAAGGHVVATYQGNSASYSNDLYLERDALGNPGVDGDTGNDLFIFNNHNSAVGSTVDLGDVVAGTELVFRLHVNNTGNNFFTGPGSRNPDQHEHARVQGNWEPATTLVSFEDLLNGPFDFNDLSFSFQNTVNNPDDVPTGAPDAGSTFALGVLALAGLAGFRNKHA